MFAKYLNSVSRFVALSSFIALTSAYASTWIPITVGEITTFVPNPELEQVTSAPLHNTSSVSIEVGSVQATQAFYFRRKDLATGAYGQWQCQSAQQVAQNDNRIIDELLTEGQYQYQVSACMTGNGCDMAGFASGTLACSDQVSTASIEVLDTSGTRNAQPSNTTYDYVGLTAAEFRVSESGAATYNVPIALPEGTAGVQPQVAIGYSSQGGDGIMGRGWNLSAGSAITRCPKTIEQDNKIGGVNFSSQDRLCLNGQRLVTNRKITDKSTSDTAYWSANARYHTEIESFSFVTPYYSGNVLTGFTVENKAGEVHYYGATNNVQGNSITGKPLQYIFNDKQGNQDTGSDAFVDTLVNQQARFWALKAIKDIKGNYILYKYQEIAETGEHYLSEIQYTGNSQHALLPYVQVVFNYERNKKATSGWQAGTPISMRKLLVGVQVYIDNHEYRTYRFDYHHSDFLDEKNYLEQINECVGEKCLQPLTFDWQKKAEITSSTELICYDPSDLGDGQGQHRRPDNQNDDEYCYTRINTDPFKPFITNEHHFTSSKSYDTAKIIDINGDGYTDIVYADGNSWKVKLGPNFHQTENLLNGKTSEHANVLVLDYDGDAVPDLLIKDGHTGKWGILGYDANFDASFCNERIGCITITSNYKSIGIPATPEQTQILDVNGDTLSDIVVSSGNQLIAYTNLGNGSFSSGDTLIDLPGANSTIGAFNQRPIKNTAGLKNASILDINGDGRSDLLFMETITRYSCDFSGGGQPRYLDSPQLQNTRTGNMPEVQRTYDDRGSCKVLGGKPKIHNEYAWHIYSSTNAGYQFTQTIYRLADFQPRVADLNGDGLTDIIWHSGNHWYYRLSDGTKLLAMQTAMEATASGTKKIYTQESDANHSYIMDVSADGRTDLLLSYEGHVVNYWSSYFSRPVPNSPEIVIFERRGTYNYKRGRFNHFSDINNDGKLDFLQGDGSWYAHKGGLADQAEDVIKTFTNGYGVSTTVDYANISDRNVYYAANSTQGFDASNRPDKNYLAPKSAYFVVSQASSQTNIGKSNTVKYGYGGLLIHKNGRGMLGFERVLTKDLQTCSTKTIMVRKAGKFPGTFIFEPVEVLDENACVTTETEYSQQFPTTGMPTKTVQTLGWGDNAILISKATNQLATKTSYMSGRFPYIKKSTETSYTLNAALTDSIALTETTSAFSYDNYGNQTSSKISVTDPSDRIDNLHLTDVINVYGASNKFRILGRLTATTTTTSLRRDNRAVKNNPDDDGVTTRKVTFSYNDDLMLETETVEPLNAAYRTKTAHTYDKFGNKGSTATMGRIAVASTAEQTRFSEQTYDERGRVVISQSNVLGHTTKIDIIGTAGFAKGRVIEIRSTGANGITQTQKPDLFGQVKTSLITASGANDPTLESKTFPAFCSATVNCPTNAHYRILQASAGAPESQIFYDRWGRELGKQVQSFDGNWSVTKQTYNADGKPLRVHEPGKGAALENTYTEFEYDRLRRVVKETKPRGTVTRTYNHNITTTTDEIGLITVEERNYLGQSVKVTSKSNSGVESGLEYQYNASGALMRAMVFKERASSHVQVTNEYNDLGHKIATADLDKGTWHYQYNAFGEMVGQTNSSNQDVTLSYDQLGRKISRLDQDGFTEWQYDQGSYAQGKLSQVSYYKGASSAVGKANYQEEYTYASHGKMLQTALAIDGEAFSIRYSYDQYNRLYYTQYPANNFTVKQTYTQLGFASALVNMTHGHRDYGKTYQQVMAMNARGQVTQVKYANNVTEFKGYESDTGWADSLQVNKHSTMLHSLGYSYYDNGNLRARDHQFAYRSGAHNFYEEFFYDGQNRLRERERRIGANKTPVSPESYRYDALGNFTYKSGVGYYKYHRSKKNRLEEVWTGANYTGTRTHKFDYDPRGNIRSDGKRTFNYTSFDKPYEVSGNGNKSLFDYGPSRQLYRQRLYTGDALTDTLYVKGLYERTKLTSGVTEHKYHVGNVLVTDRSNNQHSTLYLHKDNLGSTVSITNQTGNVVQHFSYDPWGKQTQFYAHSSLLGYSSPATSSGYTGHKMVNQLGIIHMGGRIYDPTLGRFLQADPHIQAPKNSQNYNRYSYVLNNPMSYTDPSGYFFKKLLKTTMKIGGSWHALKFLNNTPLLKSIVGAALNFIPGCQIWCTAVFNAASTFVATGSLNASLKAGAITAATAYALQGIGEHSFWGEAGSPQNILANAMVGGVSSELQGGKFGHGFFAAGLTSAFKPMVNKIGGGAANYAPARVAAAAVIGGTASKISGGKFANGAITGAFVQMFNGETALDKERRWKSMMKEFKSSITEAYKMGQEHDVDGYIAKVGTKGDWDFKNRIEYRDLAGVEEFGNFAFGATSQAWADGATMGLSAQFPSITTDLAMRGAGYYQQHFQSKQYRQSDGTAMDYNSYPGSTNYGDNWRDQAHIWMGAKYYYRMRGSN